MNCFESFCNWLNHFFIPDIPISQESIIRDLEKIGILEKLN
jgi:hypothetical protein